MSSEKKEIHNKAVCTWVLLVSNVIIYLLTGDDCSYIFGVSYQSVIVNEQVYRIFTAIFTHMDFVHLLLNMIVLCIYGKDVEHKIGSMKFIFIYFLAGIGSNVFSIYGNCIIRPEYDVYAIGASGALFGIITADMILEAKEESESIVMSVAAAIVACTIYTIITWRNGIDILGHIGGVIIGGIITGILTVRYKGLRVEKKFVKVLAICITLAFLFGVTDTILMFIE